MSTKTTTVSHSFSRTSKELEALESLFICKLCNQILKNPVTTSFCDHIFCKGCAGKHMGKTCPYCMAPMNDNSTQVDHQMSTLVYLASKLRDKLADTSSQDTKEPILDETLQSVLNTSHSSSLIESFETTKNESHDSSIQQTPRSQKKLNTSHSSSLIGSLETTKNESHNSSIQQTPRSKKKRNAKGETPLHIAAIKGDYKTAEELLQEGCNPNMKDNAGWSPLHEACNHGHKEMVELLLKHGAAVNLTGWENATPLHDAVINNRYEVVKVLLKNGAAVGMRNRRGATPVDLAATEEMKELFQKYLDDVNVVSPSAHVAVREERDICIVTTGLDSEQRSMMQQLVDLLGGTVVTEITDKVTHIVALCSMPRHCARTLKYLQGILKGVWIVDFRWVERCLQMGEKVSEIEFEVTGAGLQLDSKGPTKARLNAEGQYPFLFDGCHFFFSGNFSSPHPSRGRLSELIKAGGGVLLNREPRSQSLSNDIVTVPYHAPQNSPLSKCSYFVISCENKFSVKNNICRASADWLLDCIGAFQLLDQ